MTETGLIILGAFCGLMMVCLFLIFIKEFWDLSQEEDDEEVAEDYDDEVQPIDLTLLRMERTRRYSSRYILPWQRSVRGYEWRDEEQEDRGEMAENYNKELEKGKLIELSDKNWHLVKKGATLYKRYGRKGIDGRSWGTREIIEVNPTHLIYLLGAGSSYRGIVKIAVNIGEVNYKRNYNIFYIEKQRDGKLVKKKEKKMRLKDLK